MEKLQPHEAQALLRKKGMDVTLEQAAEILKFLRMLSDIVVTNYLDNKQDKKETPKK